MSEQETTHPDPEPAPRILEGNSLEEILSVAEKEFNVSGDKLHHKVLQKGGRGLFGLGSTPWRVEVSLKVEKKKRLSIAAIQNTLAEATEILANRDGRVEFDCHDNAVWLKVFPPEGSGQRVSLDDVVREVRRPGVKKVDAAAITSAIAAGDPDTPIKIADFEEGAQFHKDALPVLTVSADARDVTLSIEPPVGEGNHPTLEQVLDMIKSKGITLEPNREAIQDFLMLKDYSRSIKIVSALPPSEPQNGYVQWLYGQDSESNAQEDSRRKKDYRQVLQIDNVPAGNPIGKVIPPESGMDGIDVFGKTIPAREGKPAKVALGKNVELAADGMTIVSLIDGQFILKGKIPNIFPLFEVFGDVNYGVGNINFLGNVKIHGSVNDGFEIRAEGTIHVQGSVERARIESGDSITIDGGIVGKDKGIIIATREIHCKFAENAHLHAGERVICEKNLINCRVTAGNKVYVRGSSDGVIVGGQVMAGDEIETDIIGSTMGIRTVIVVGIDLSQQEALNRLLMQVAQLEEHQSKVQKLSELLKRNDERSKEEDKLLIDANKTLTQLTMQIQDLNRRKDKMENEIEVNRRGVIRAHKMIYPDVWVRVRRGMQRIDTAIKASAIGYDGENMRILPL